MGFDCSTHKDIIGELVPSAERERSRFERAATEAEQVPQGREHLRLIIAQRSQVSADRAAWRDGRSRDSHLRIIRDYVKRKRPGGLHNPLLSDGGGGIKSVYVNFDSAAAFLCNLF